MQLGFMPNTPHAVITMLATTCSAGVITSRNLTQPGLKPCMFEKQSKLGGLWSVNNSNKDNFNNKEEQYLKLNTNIWKTNLSKCTCCFSDLLHDDNEKEFLDRNEIIVVLIVIAIRIMKRN